jgi:hypothetical protein
MERSSQKVRANVEPAESRQNWHLLRRSRLPWDVRPQIRRTPNALSVPVSPHRPGSPGTLGPPGMGGWWLNRKKGGASARNDRDTTTRRSVKPDAPLVGSGRCRGCDYPLPGRRTKAVEAIPLHLSIASLPDMAEDDERQGVAGGWVKKRPRKECDALSTHGPIFEFAKMGVDEAFDVSSRSHVSFQALLMVSTCEQAFFYRAACLAAGGHILHMLVREHTLAAGAHVHPMSARWPQMFVVSPSHQPVRMLAHSAHARLRPQRR